MRISSSPVKEMRRQTSTKNATITGFRWSIFVSESFMSSEVAAPDVTTYPFKLTDEQEHLRREIRDFAQREILPNVMKWDEASEFPTDAVMQLGQMGLMGIIFPVEYGGAGLGYVD